MIKNCYSNDNLIIPLNFDVIMMLADWQPTSYLGKITQDDR